VIAIIALGFLAAIGADVIMFTIYFKQKIK
jgi:hypothetical protein